jgi:hypothetical protein
MFRSIVATVSLGLCATLVAAVGCKTIAGEADAKAPARSSYRSTTVADSGKDPQAAIDDAGLIYVVYGNGDAIRCAVSTDATGSKFQKPVTIHDRGVLSIGMRRGPRIAISRRSIVVTAVVGDHGNGRDGDLLAWRSTDRGTTWSKPTPINRVQGSAREGLHATASGPEGLVYAAWLDDRNGRKEVFGAGSHDGGITWEPDKLVYRSPEKSVCECCHPSVAFGPDRSVYVMWRNNIQGARDLYFSRSTDLGARFAPALKLGDRSWILNGCPMDGGAIAVDRAGNVATVWLRAGTVVSASPTRDELTIGDGVQPWLAFDQTEPVIVWLDRRPGRLSIRRGLTSAAETIVESGAIDPVVAANPARSGSVVVWEQAGAIRAAKIEPNH